MAKIEKLLTALPLLMLLVISISAHAGFNDYQSQYQSQPIQPMGDQSQAQPTQVINDSFQTYPMKQGYTSSCYTTQTVLETQTFYQTITSTEMETKTSVAVFTSVFFETSTVSVTVTETDTETSVVPISTTIEVPTTTMIPVSIPISQTVLLTESIPVTETIPITTAIPITEIISVMASTCPDVSPVSSTVPNGPLGPQGGQIYLSGSALPTIPISPQEVPYQHAPTSVPMGGTDMPTTPIDTFGGQLTMPTSAPSGQPTVALPPLTPLELRVGIFSKRYADITAEADRGKICLLQAPNGLILVQLKPGTSLSGPLLIAEEQILKGTEAIPLTESISFKLPPGKYRVIEVQGHRFERNKTDTSIDFTECTQATGPIEDSRNDLTNGDQRNYTGDQGNAAAQAQKLIDVDLGSTKNIAKVIPDVGLFQQALANLDQHAIYMAPGFSLSMALAAATLGDPTMDPVVIEVQEHARLCAAFAYFEASHFQGKASIHEAAAKLVVQMTLSHSLFCAPDLVFRYFLQRESSCPDIPIWAPLFASVGVILWLEKNAIEEAQIYLSEEISFWKRAFFISWDVLVALLRLCKITVDEQSSARGRPIFPENAVRSLLGIKIGSGRALSLLSEWISLLLNITGEAGISSHNFEINAPACTPDADSSSVLPCASVSNLYTNHKTFDIDLGFSEDHPEQPLRALMDALRGERAVNPLTTCGMDAIIRAKLETLVQLSESPINLAKAPWFPFCFSDQSLCALSSSPAYDLPTRSLLYLILLKLGSVLPSVEKEILTIYCIQESKRVRLLAKFLQANYKGDSWIWEMVALDFFRTFVRLGIVKGTDSPYRNKYARSVFLKLKRMDSVFFCNSNDMPSIQGSATSTLIGECESKKDLREVNRVEPQSNLHTILSTIGYLEDRAQVFLARKYPIQTRAC
ncbi:hypothetical protein MDAP_000269 [Mitosporidium daphniae]